MTELVLSCLPKTWLIDIDGVILKHNGYKQDGEILLPGVKKFWHQISQEDFVILLTARTEEMREATLSLLDNHGLRYNIAIFGVPTGERICINDKKASGLLTSYAVNLWRDVGLDSLKVVKNPDL
ncbi:MAG: hypothetical protein WAN66_20825 [Limnoraphis robusta]|uniref:FCP1 homology domain-containing protein n=1 Tax=Limnoraphis robusta CS-951 TaxID=1637645 RepID=A0A0F5YJ87_9CYAN|nr:hypothetical protein [Limnoraphis robusta]KKD38823.1 hypothetical protein WN50_06865 [Limnoraphis robusta CS-951]